MAAALGLASTVAIACQKAGAGSPGSLSCSVDAGAGVAATVAAACDVGLDFGAVALGQDLSAVVRIENRGGAALSFLPFTPSLDPEFAVDFAGLQTPLSPGGSVDLPITYHAVAEGPITSTLDLAVSASQASNPDVQIVLSAEGIPVDLTVSPSQFDFGSVLLTTSETQTLVLTNASKAPLTGIEATVVGVRPEEAADFTHGIVPASLKAGESASVDVTCAPRSSGTIAFVSITFTGGDHAGSASAQFSCTPLDGALSTVSGQVEFGFVPPGSSVVACTQVWNQANVAVSIEGLSSLQDDGGVFALASTDDQQQPIDYPLSLDAGASAELCFEMTPPMEGEFFGAATIESTDPTGKTPVVQLHGWGGGPQIQCAPAAIDFGEVPVGGAAHAWVMCTNTGTANPNTGLQLSASVSSTAANQFQADPPGSYQLAPGESTGIGVDFNPYLAGEWAATLAIASNGGQGRDIDIPLAGHAAELAPCLVSITPSRLDFGNLALGSALDLSLEIANQGTDDCLLSPIQLFENDSSYRLTFSSLQPNPVTYGYLIPAPGGTASSSLTMTFEFSPSAPGDHPAELGFYISNPASIGETVDFDGTSEASCLLAAPRNIELGVVGTESGAVCGGIQVGTATFFDRCRISTALESVSVQSGPGDEVPQVVTQSPPVPAQLDPDGGSIGVSVLFEPTSVGDHSAQVLASDGTVSTLIPVTGTVIGGKVQTDTFVAGVAKVDLLLVLDQADFDQPIRDTIADGFEAFLAAAGTAVDYRIAVTGDDDADHGQLFPCPTCSLVGSVPAILSASTEPDGGANPDPAAALRELLDAVPSEAASGREHFFDALLNAMTQRLSPGIDFFRRGATLAAITDEAGVVDDDSALDEDWYAGFFLTYLPQHFVWSFIGESSNVSGGGALAAPQLPPRIAAMVDSTNGVAVNVSSTQWPSALSALWQNALQRSSYTLSGTPANPQAISVTQNGSGLPSNVGSVTNWSYNSAQNAILFAPGVVALGDNLSVSYSLCE